MRFKNICFFSFIFLLIAVIGFSATNPRWDPVSIFMSPVSATEGVSVTFNASFVTERALVENLKVVGGVDSTEIFNHTYSSILGGTYTSVSFTWIATSGEHTAYLNIDPDNEIVEHSEADNYISLSFMVSSSPEGGGPLPNLVFPSSYFNWTPFYFNSGDVVTINYMVTNNGDGHAGPFNVGLRVGSTIVMSNRISGISGVDSTSGSFTWTADCSGYLALVADCDAEVSETNEGDNVINDDHFRCIKPNVYVERISISGSGDDNERCSGPPYQLLATIRASREMGVDDIRVVGGYEGGSVFLDETIAHLDPGAASSVTFVQVWSIGTHNVYFNVDPDNTIAELNEEDNYMPFTVTGVDCSEPEDTDDSDTSSGGKELPDPSLNTWVKILNKAALNAKIFSPPDNVSVTGAIGITKKAIPSTLNELKVKATFKKIGERLGSRIVYEHTFMVRNNSSQKFKFNFALGVLPGDYELFIRVTEHPMEARDKLRDNTDSAMIRVRK